jgi:hypothetical protein
VDARHLVPDAMPPVPSWKASGFAVAAALPRTPSDSLHDPPLQPRDEAVFLLTAAAEVEHALMVQYLYAAYSVRVAGPQAATLRTVQDLLVQIAREEMGHLATVQNLLRLVGGSLHLGREHSAQAGGIAPFRFRLEPLSLDSLAKYVTAESPAEPPPELSAETGRWSSRSRRTPPWPTAASRSATSGRSSSAWPRCSVAARTGSPTTISESTISTGRRGTTTGVSTLSGRKRVRR